MTVVPLILRRLDALALVASRRMADLEGSEANAVHSAALQTFVDELADAGLGTASVQTAAQIYSDRMIWFVAVERFALEHQLSPSGAEALRRAHGWREDVIAATAEAEEAAR